MERKVKLDISAPLIVGAVFALIGAIFLVLGVVLGASVETEDAVVLRLVFAGIGGLFFVIGVIFLAFVIRKKQRQDALVRTGRYVWGEIADYRYNYNIHVNGRYAIILMVRYFDPYGTVHYFKSRNLYNYGYTELIGQKVKVYFDGSNFNRYYVDLDERLLNAVEH